MAMVVVVEIVYMIGPFRHLAVQQRKPLNDRDKLITQVQILPGFETFLMAPSFDHLQPAAAHGPVIIIYH
jgi:hypothetical protein